MLNRRELLRTGLLSLGAGVTVPTMLSRAAAAAAAETSSSGISTPDGQTLIVVQLAGGNDGLNTVVPHADSRYRTLRPNLALPQDDVLVIDDRHGFHKSMTGLKGLFDRGDLAVVESVGYAHPSFSHFQAMDIWQTADPTEARREGWLAQLVEGAVDANGHPLGALALGTQIPPALCCPPVLPPVLERADLYRLQSDTRNPALSTNRDAALRRLYQSYQAPAPYATVLEETSSTAEKSVKELQASVGSYRAAVEYPKTPLADGLKVFASLIASGAGLKIGYVVLGGFDTHANQVNQHAMLLSTLDSAVTAFMADMAAQGRSDKVLLVTWSEFGRRAAQNASGGTDHGSAAPLFLAGGRVRGGFFGAPPDLSRLDNGNIPFAVDFRSIYSTILEQWMQTDSKPLLGGNFATLPILRSA